MALAGSAVAVAACVNSGEYSLSRVTEQRDVVMTIDHCHSDYLCVLTFPWSLALPSAVLLVQWYCCIILG